MNTTEVREQKADVCALPETMADADADLANIVVAALRAVKVAWDITPAAPNMQARLRSLRQIEIRVLQAQVLLDEMRGIAPRMEVLA